MQHFLTNLLAQGRVAKLLVVNSTTVRIFVDDGGSAGSSPDSSGGGGGEPAGSSFGDGSGGPARWSSPRTRRGGS